MKKNFEIIKKQLKEKYKYCNLYVKSIPDSITEPQLAEIFGKFGSIRSLKVVRKEIQTSTLLGFSSGVKTFAFVCFSAPEEANEAKRVLNNTVLFQGFPQKLFVDYFQTKSERNDFLQLQRNNQINRPISQGRPQDTMANQMISRMVPQARQLMPNQGNPIMRSFPPNQAFIKDTRQEIRIPEDPDERREMLGEILYEKITLIPQLATYSQ